MAHNGFDPDGTPIQFPTRVELDIEGNQRSVTDALGRIAMRYDRCARTFFSAVTLAATITFWLTQ